MKISFALLGLASVTEVGIWNHCRTIMSRTLCPLIRKGPVRLAFNSLIFRLMTARQLISAMQKIQSVIRPFVVSQNGIAMILKQLQFSTLELNVRVMLGEQ